MSQGGVARNVAENMARLGLETILITAVGDDPLGHQILTQAAEAGVTTDHAIVSSEHQTGAYLAIIDERGSLHLAMADMGVVASISSDYLKDRLDLFKESAAVVIDANLAPKTLSTAVSLAHRARIPIAADPTSVSLALSLKKHLPRLWLVTPNEAEAAALTEMPVSPGNRDQALNAARELVSQGVEIAIITMAELGVFYATADSSGHVPAVQTEILDPTGAGDALTAAVFFALLNGIPLDEAIRLGVSAAALTLRTRGSVVPNLSLELLYAQLR